MEKKRHHYVPKAYLRFFSDEEEKLRVYLKDAPEKVLYQSPDNTAFEKYYYSQPLPEGGTDNNSLEDQFSLTESAWPPIVEKLRNGDDINDQLETLFTFIALQRARVPASRDAQESMLAATVLATARQLDAMGKLPPKPKGFEDILDHVGISIDPHKSIHGMVDTIRAMGTVFSLMGIGALHNRTDIPFLTSDNPVIWFDPSVPEDSMQPYRIKPDGEVVLLFPVTPSLIIYGHSSMKERFSQYGFGYGELDKRPTVKAMNRQICRFAYKSVFAQKPGQEALIKKYASISPVLRTQVLSHEEGEFLVHQSVFGERPTKPKWKG